MIARPAMDSACQARATAARRAPRGWWVGLLLVCLFWWSGMARAQALVPVPTLTARVTDLTGTLTGAQRQALEDRLAAFERERGSQVLVLMLASTAPEDIADYTQRVGDAWKPGRQGVGDGVLLVVAKEDRRLRIATMKAVEGAIPDLVAKRIIDEAITPRFRQGDFAGGLEAGIDRITAQLRGEDWPLPSASEPGTADDTDWEGVLVLFGFASIMLTAVARQLLGNKWGLVLAPGAIGAVVGWLSASFWIGLGAGFLAFCLGVVSAALKWAPTVHGRRWSGGGHWGGGGFGGGSGGGGFSSGGGGDSGGGGASGGW